MYNKVKNAQGKVILSDRNINDCKVLFGKFIKRSIVYLQVMAFGLFMMDNKENSIYKMEQRKRVNIAKIDKILKVSREKES